MDKVAVNTKKQELRKRLWDIAMETLKEKGWKVEKAPGGKSSVHLITKDGKTEVVAIRTSQDTWISFPRNMENNGWETLSKVDKVVAVSVDDRKHAKFANVHMIPADEMRKRFDEAYKARTAAKYDIELGRGMFLSLYDKNSNDSVMHVGAGAGLAYPPIATVPLEPTGAGAKNHDADEAPLTIPEAKRRLAKTLGVDPASIKITIEG